MPLCISNKRLKCKQPEDGLLHRQLVEEEEEEIQSKLEIQRMEVPEEEAMQTKPEIQRMETPEEEEAVQPKLDIQRMEAPEEEEVQTKPEIGAPAVRTSLSAQLQHNQRCGNPLPSQRSLRQIYR